MHKFYENIFPGTDTSWIDLYGRPRVKIAGRTANSRLKSTNEFLAKCTFYLNQLFSSSPSLIFFFFNISHRGWRAQLWSPRAAFWKRHAQLERSLFHRRATLRSMILDRDRDIDLRRATAYHVPDVSTSGNFNAALQPFSTFDTLNPLSTLARI